MEMTDLKGTLAALVSALRATIHTEFTSVWLPIQLGTIAVVLLVAAGASALLRRKADLVNATMAWPGYMRLVVRVIASHLTLLIFIGLMMVVRTAIHETVAFPRTYLLTVAIDLATAWFVIAVLTSMIRNPFVNRLVAISTWTIAALSILNLLDPITNALDAAAITIGGLRLTPLLVLKTVVLLLIALWLAAALANFLNRRIQSAQGLTPSMQVLIGKVLNVALLTLATLIVLRSAGIDLTALAWFSGAVGVGLGFGLQKIIANFVSGIILLADKSIKPGDVITVGEHFGWVSTMGARYTSLDLKDGRELLVPNEDLITQRVVNWSYTSDLMRLEVKFSTTYDSDIHKTREVAAAAAKNVDHVLKDPAPVCHLTGYSASAIDYVLWFWIKDANEGPTRVRSAVLVVLWDAFEREGVKLPKPGPQHVVLERGR